MYLRVGNFTDPQIRKALIIKPLSDYKKYIILILFDINQHFRAVTYHADYQTFTETRFPCGGESHISNALWVNGLAARNLESVRVRTRKKPQMTDAQ